MLAIWGYSTLSGPLVFVGSWRFGVSAGLIHWQMVYVKNAASKFKPFLFILPGQEAHLYRQWHGNEIRFFFAEGTAVCFSGDLTTFLLQRRQIRVKLRSRPGHIPSKPSDVRTESKETTGTCAG